MFVCLSATVVLVFYVFERERENVRLALELSHFIVLSHRLGRHATLLPNKCVTAYKYPECQAFLGGNLLSPSPIGRGKVRRAWIVYVPHFHAVVVQKRQRNVQKSMMHAQSCCFANLSKPVAFLPFSLPSSSLLLKPPDVTHRDSQRYVSRNTELQCCNYVVAMRNNVAAMLKALETRLKKKIIKTTIVPIARQ